MNGGGGETGAATPGYTFQRRSKVVGKMKNIFNEILSAPKIYK